MLKKRRDISGNKGTKHPELAAALESFLFKGNNNGSENKREIGGELGSSEGLFPVMQGKQH